MTEWADPTKIIACAIRPQASWIHLISLLGFVWAAWSVSPARAAIEPDRS